MNPVDSFLHNLERRTLLVAAALAAVAVVAGCFEGPWVESAYRLAAFTCLAPAVGSLVIILIHRTTGGQWTAGLAIFLSKGAASVPWIWLLTVPVAVLPWPAASGHRHLALDSSYEGLPMVLVRAAVIAVIFFLLRAWVADGTGHERAPQTNRRPWVGPVGLILILFTLSFIADDWLESLEKGWHSTAFPIVWASSQVVTGLALALVLGLETGSRPERDGSAGRTIGIDWGNLLLATSMFWTYVAFSEFLIIWSGNLPEEISWYVHRTQGGWMWLLPVVALGGFALPLLLLLSRRLKKTPAGLVTVAGMVLGAHWLYLVWVIVPSGGLPSPLALLFLTATAGAAAAFFINRYARGARLSRVPSL